MKKIISILMIISIVTFNIVIAPPMNPASADTTIKVPILLYHNIMDGYAWDQSLLNISPDEFRIHMQALKDNDYNAISFYDYYDHVNKGKQLPDKPVIISFDDGYTSNYTYAYPILKELNMKATIFIVTDRMGAGWMQGITYPHFSWEEAREMQASGVIDIESHSDTHGNMAVMSKQDLQREFRRSKYILEKNLNKECDVFAFPYGGNTAEARQLGILAGYKMLCLVGDVGSNSAGEDMSGLKRITISGHLQAHELLDLITQNLD